MFHLEVDTSAIEELEFPILNALQVTPQTLNRSQHLRPRPHDPTIVRVGLLFSSNRWIQMISWV